MQLIESIFQELEANEKILLEANIKVSDVFRMTEHEKLKYLEENYGKLHSLVLSIILKSSDIDRESRVWTAIARHFKLSEDIIKQMLLSKNINVLTSLLKNNKINITPKLQHFFYNTKDPFLIDLLSHRIDLEKDIIMKMIKEQPESILVNLFGNPNLDDEALVEMMKIDNPTIQMLIISNSSIDLHDKISMINNIEDEGRREKMKDMFNRLYF